MWLCRRALAAMDVQVDTIISSPLKRSTTAVLVGNEIGHEGKLVMDAALRPSASFSAESFWRSMQSWNLEW